MKDREPLQKLDEAILALKGAGYEFSEHSIVDKEIFGTHCDYAVRVIEVKCRKFLSVEGSVSRGLEGFSKDTLTPQDPALIPRQI